MAGEARIGISGWTYSPWRGVFYPRGLPQRKELEYAASRLRTLELNGTFYSLQRPHSYAAWRAAAPEGFVFSVKGPRFITHVRRLKDSETPLANFFASGVLRLGPLLGPLLWQMPPSFHLTEENGRRLREFFALLPRSTGAAAAMARRHDQRLDGRDWLECELDMPLRHALEIRHDSFLTPEFFSLLREQRIALVMADTAGKWPRVDEATADFAYARLHGDTEIYASGYTPKALDVWAERINGWTASGRDAFVYFDNDVKVRAPYDAMSLAHRLGWGPDPGPAPRVRRPPVLRPASQDPRWSRFGRRNPRARNVILSRRART